MNHYDDSKYWEEIILLQELWKTENEIKLKLTWYRSFFWPYN